MAISKPDKQAFTISVSLHGVVLLSLLLVLLWGHLFEPEDPPHVFELVSNAPSQPSPEPVMQPAQDLPPLAMPEMPDAPEIRELPEPPPPAPAPVQRPPKPQPQPKPRPEPPPAQAISAEEFFERFGRPDTPTQTQPARRRPVEVQQIEVRQLMQNLSSAADQQRVAQLSTADQDTLSRYFAALRERLNASWQQPREAPIGLSAEVSFTVSPNGTISNARITRSSGDAAFDQSVLNAFVRMGRFQPTPDQRSYPLRVPFRVSE